MMRRIVLFLGILFLCAGLFAGVFLYRAKTMRSGYTGERVFSIGAGEDIRSIARRLDEAGLVASEWYFLWSAWTGGLGGRVRAGDFVIPGKRTAPEVVALLRASEGKPKEVSITFPEGWTADKMAARLSANNFDGERFLALVRDPFPEWREKFPILETLPKGSSLEGFLFPDTYSFALDASSEMILERLLRNFDEKFDMSLRTETARQGKSVFEVVTMASILEREIGTANQSKETIERDRKIVSDIFWRRFKDGYPLESCATVQFVLGTNKTQLSIEETRTDSPYNTYVNKGLPPGPISNPGGVSLRAALFPEANTFYFFLNNPETGKTFFATTFEEHKANKVKNGL